jgi:outer membrane biosynthesis protein TonB
VETSQSSEKSLFELALKSKGVTVNSPPFTFGRLLIGRVESCDIVISHLTVSAVHAVIEVSKDGAKIYDMNSTNGTFVQGEKVVAQEVQFGDIVKIADIEFIFQYYVQKEELPPVLDMLDPKDGAGAILPNLPQNIPTVAYSKEDVEKVMPQSTPKDKGEETPYIVYPLASDPKAEFSEYIFEDLDELYPIFKYEIGQEAVEVIILNKDNVFSVDYLPLKNGRYHLAGSKPNKGDIEYPYLGKEDRVPFVEVINNEVHINGLSDYELFHLSDDKKKDSGPSFILNNEDLARFAKGDNEVYVRKVSAPPKVAKAPFFRRDKNLRKYLFLMFFFILAPLAALQNFQVDEDLEKEKAPERIATILYKKKLTVSKTKAVEKTKEAPKKVQKAPKKKTKPKKPTPKKVAKKPAPKKAVTKKPTPKPKKAGVKTAKKVQQVKKGVSRPKKITKKPKSVNRPSRRLGPRTKSASSASASRTRRKTVGRVDTYKSADFKSTISSVLAKGGAFKKVKSATGSGSAQNLRGANVGGGSTGDLKQAEISGNVGSLSGATVGKLDTSKGAEGLSAKRSIYTAGIPSETVVLGSMDPDIIRQILMEHIPQFRYCYQKELESNNDIFGVVKMNFIIGASGHVTRAAVSGKRMPVPVRRCVANVLRGIQFPAPRGGGQVEVTQPINFQSKKLK